MALKTSGSLDLAARSDPEAFHRATAALDLRHVFSSSKTGSTTTSHTSPEEQA
jgi:hypothetical protein